MLYFFMILLAITIVLLSMGLFYSLNEEEDRALSLLFSSGIILAFSIFTFACFKESKQRTLDNVANGVKYEKVDGVWKELKPEEPEQVKTINQ